jgi:hypothetical protein
LSATPPTFQGEDVTLNAKTKRELHSLVLRGGTREPAFFVMHYALQI